MMTTAGIETQVISEVAPSGVRRLRRYRLAGGPGGADVAVSASRFRIGSHPANDLVVTDESVSRFHAVIEATAAGFLLRDLDSTNGLWVDGLRVVEAYLPARAKLRLGRAQLSFELSDELDEIPRSAARSFHGLIAASTPMRELFAQIERAAPTQATVLIQGESGSGKEGVASALHRASDRAAGPFVVLDCAAVPRALMESELFGHERGAFTGAVSRSEGRFAQADGGTLFLDEIGELPLEMQPKLLRVLESKQVRRIGATRGRRVDVRLVAATNRDLAREVNRGAFREDLYYRLAVIQLQVPPLRDRRDDIRPLVAHFIRAACAEQPARADELLRSISKSNWERIEQLPWRGNVRELRNFIERTLILSDRGITSAVVPAPPDEPRVAAKAETPRPTPGGGAPVDLDRPFSRYKAEVIAAFERDYLLGQLARHDNNISAAARASGLDRMNFKRLLRKYR